MVKTANMPKGLKAYWRKQNAKKTSKRRNTTMAKRKSNSYSRRRKVRVPVAIVGGFIPLIAKATADFQAGGWQGLQNTVPAIVPYSPANKSFTTAQLHRGLYPIIIGYLVHKVIGGWLGVNRMLSSAGVPVIRL